MNNTKHVEIVETLSCQRERTVHPTTLGQAPSLLIKILLTNLLTHGETKEVNTKEQLLKVYFSFDANAYRMMDDVSLFPSIVEKIEPLGGDRNVFLHFLGLLD